MNELALFAGAGGGILAGKLLGWRTVCAVERDAYAASVLAQRQNDGALEPFPVWSDVCSFDGRPWRGRVDVISGGFPCQDISAAGKGAGIEGERSGLWKEFARIICEVRPRYVFVENSPMLTSRGLGRVLGDLAALGYDAQWGVLGASDLGCFHIRERIWLLAYAPSIGWNARPHDNILYGKNTTRCKRWSFIPLAGACSGVWATPIGGIHRVADELANRVDRLKAIGNGQVPRVAAEAWILLKEATHG